MSTVTFFPRKEQISFTSNHDEQQLPVHPSVPAVQEPASGKVIFPEMETTAGTWIAGHENGNFVAFLHGALSPHVPTPPYRKSLGMVLLDLIDHTTPVNCFLAVKLNNIEPFTAVVRDNGHLFECFWDGKQKTYEEVDQHQPAIWMSVTLYHASMIERRKVMFAEYIQSHPTPSENEIVQFHQSLPSSDNSHPKNTFHTQSITSIAIDRNHLNLLHLDNGAGRRYSQQINSVSSMATK